MTLKRVLNRLFILLVLITIAQCCIKEIPVNEDVLNYFEYPVHKVFWASLPYEVVEIEFDDQTFFYITSKMAIRVLINPAKLQYIIETWFSRKISNISMITHNHVDKEAYPDFTNGDLGFLDGIKKLGFTGRFRLWVNRQFKEI